MDLFFALRGGQIGRSVMWSNGAILPILGIICILSIAGVILIYSYSAAFEAFRKSLREKTARYLAIFLVLMELCGMTYVDLYHTHLLGGLGKTAAKWGGRGSHASRAAQEISRLPLDSPAYKVFQDIKNYNPSYDSPYTLKANIEEVLEDKNLDPDIRLELEKVHNWSLAEVQKRDVRAQAVRAQEDAQWEKLKNTTDSWALTMAINRLRQGGEMSQEQLEDCYRTILLAEGNPKFALTQETIDYARGLIGDRLPQENLARIENEALAIWRTSQGAAPANPAAGAPVSQNSSSTSGPQTSPVPTTGQPNTNGGSSSEKIPIQSDDLSNSPSAHLQEGVPPLGRVGRGPSLRDIADMSDDALQRYVREQLAREPGQLDENAHAAFARFWEGLKRTGDDSRATGFEQVLQDRHPGVLPSDSGGPLIPTAQSAPINGAAPVPPPLPKTAVPGQSSGPVVPSTGAHPGQNAPASSGPSQYHPSGQLNGGALGPPPTAPVKARPLGIPVQQQNTGGRPLVFYVQQQAPKKPGLFGRTLNSAWGATQFSGLPITAPTHLVGGVSNAANTWHPYLQGLAAKNGWKGVVGRTVEPAVGALSKLPQKGVPYGQWSDLTPAQRLLHIGAAGGNLTLGGYSTLWSDLAYTAGAGVRAVENPSLGNAGNFVHALWDTGMQPYKNIWDTVTDASGTTNKVNSATQKIQGDSDEEEQQ